MKKLNVYDFDHTIYHGDCMFDFYFFCIMQKPTLLRYLPYQCWSAALFVLRIKTRTALKSSFFVFLNGIEDIDSLVNSFWDQHIDRIKQWYLVQKKSTDVIVTASPYFLVRPVLEQLDIKALIATNMDVKTGKITGKNCRGTEKLKRFKSELPNVIINKMYSDSLSDLPLLRLAQSPIIVLGSRMFELERYLKLGWFSRRVLKLKSHLQGN